MPAIICDKPTKRALARFIFAHGSGAGMKSDFMQLMAESLVTEGVEVVRFNFAYMQQAEDEGRKRPPSGQKKLLQEYAGLLQQYRDDLPLFIGGKSMGGRMASMLLQDSAAIGGICMGYPFHPPGKLDKLRIEHLQPLQKPLLVLQGERDTFGTKEQIASYPLSSSVQCRFLADGDHSFKPRKSASVCEQQNLQQAVTMSVEFMQQQIKENL